jgi:hypothetical protein
MLQVPNGAYGHFLLGQVAKLTNRHEKAIKQFRQCLTLNPMLWSAHEELCKLGMHRNMSLLLPCSPAALGIATKMCLCDYKWRRSCATGAFEAASSIINAPEAQTQPAATLATIAAFRGNDDGTPRLPVATAQPLAPAAAPFPESSAPTLPGQDNGGGKASSVLAPRTAAALVRARVLLALVLHFKAAAS